MSTLDNVVGARFAGERLLVKIGVEGAEYGVLQGASLTLARQPAPAWLLEVCLQEFHPEGANPDFLAIFSLFRDHGYRAYAVGSTLRPVGFDEVTRWWQNLRSDAGTLNYLFLAEGRAPPA